MGVLSRRRSPLDHLLELKGALCAGGELVLETLVVEGDERTVLMPEDRYAVMRNVFFLPSVAMLTRWLERCGFVDVRCVWMKATPRCKSSDPRTGCVSSRSRIFWIRTTTALPVKVIRPLAVRCWLPESRKV